MSGLRLELRRVWLRIDEASVKPPGQKKGVRDETMSSFLLFTILEGRSRTAVPS